MRVGWVGWSKSKVRYAESCCAVCESKKHVELLVRRLHRETTSGGGSIMGEGCRENDMGRTLDF
jgi:hypothetical protein